MSVALQGFASGGYAFRAAERAAIRPLLAVTIATAVRDAEGAAAVAVRAAIPPVTSRLRASLLGRREMTGPIDAALLNGVAAASTATIGTAAVCAALAAGESTGAAGATVLDAIVAGVEVALRVERALRGHEARGWDVRSTVGRLGAAVAAARALGLQRVAMQNAFGLAATAAAGLRAARGTTAEGVLIGSAAADGVEAALLARAEFTAAPAALDGRRGFAALMADGLDASVLVDALGERSLVADLVVAAMPLSPELSSAVDGLERAGSLAELLAAAHG